MLLVFKTKAIYSAASQLPYIHNSRSNPEPI